MCNLSIYDTVTYILHEHDVHVSSCCYMLELFAEVHYVCLRIECNLLVYIIYMYYIIWYENKVNFLQNILIYHFVSHIAYTRISRNDTSFWEHPCTAYIFLVTLSQRLFWKTNNQGLFILIRQNFINFNNNNIKTFLL
jgi:hypothetical protein